MPPPNDREWWCEKYAGDGTVLALRREVHERRFIELTQKMETAWPALRSALLCFAQYWDDNADDQVHVDVFASDRVTPEWPHVCDEGEGERCHYCEREAVPWVDWGYGELVPSFEAYCHERGNQNHGDEFNCRPYAIARRNVHGGFEVEHVGRIVRPWLDMPRALPEPLPLDPTAQALLERVAKNSDAEAARHVLADHLLERGDPRGEYLAESMRGAISEATWERWAEQHRSWMGALAPFVPRGGAHFDRGLLTRAELYVAEENDVTRLCALDDFGAFAALEQIKFSSTSLRFVSPAMRHARVLGPLDASALASLVGGDVVFECEELELELDFPGALSLLVDASNLPRLSVVRLVGVPSAGAHNAFMLPLARLDIASDWNDGFESMLALLPRTFPLRLMQLDPDSRVAEGWAITIAPNLDRAIVERTAVTPETSIGALERALAALPRPMRLDFRPGPYWDPRDELIARLQRQ